MDYFYDVNFIYSGQAERKLDPLETRFQGVEVFLKIPNATSIPPPPMSENESAVYDPTGETWAIIADFRLKTVYETSTKEDLEWLNIGDLSDGYTLLVPPSGFAKWDEINNIWDDDPAYKTLSEEIEWISDELTACDVMRAYYATGDTSRQTATAGEWDAYTIALRDYIVDGAIATAKPEAPI